MPIPLINFVETALSGFVGLSKLKVVIPTHDVMSILHNAYYLTAKHDHLQWIFSEYSERCVVTYLTVRQALLM